MRRQHCLLSRFSGCWALVLGLAGAGVAQGAASQWDFNGNLNASYGPGVITYWTPSAQAGTTFGTTTSFGIPNIGGQPSGVMKFPAADGTTDIAYQVDHKAPINGGGAYVNQYTMIWDVFIPQATATTGWVSFYNTTAVNGNDGDLFLDPGNALGISGIYDGSAPYDQWHRIAVTLDATNVTEDGLRKYINGALVGAQDAGGVDGRWTLYAPNDGDPDPYEHFFILADNDFDHDPGYISSFYFVDRVLTDAEIAAIGGADADGILASTLVKGDMNNDSAVDNEDISGFVLALIDLDAYQTSTGLTDGVARGDINNDAALDNEDIGPFVTLLLGGGAAAVPEPASVVLLVLGGAGVLRIRRRRG
jgi:Concanavalin A-like lectin/glucanases superfamily